MEIFSDIMILTNYSPKLKKIRQIIAAILANLEEDFYSEKARKIAKMWKKLANYFLEQQGWTRFLEKTYFFSQRNHEYSEVYQWCTAGLQEGSLLLQVSAKTVGFWVYIIDRPHSTYTILKSFQKIDS